MTTPATQDPLPVDRAAAEIVAALQACPRLVLRAPTGSGKSTRVPGIMLDAGLVRPDEEIVILQPRRLAARMLAKRVAAERGCPLGEEVGYQIRFDRVCSASTRIRFVTEGLLLRQMLDDPQLKGVGAVVFDEFHERHLYSDITLGLARRLQTGPRPDLKIVVMSATLDTAGLDTWLAPAKTVAVEGRQFPITMDYAAAPALVGQKPVWDQAAFQVVRRIKEGHAGDVLVFMPGGYEIQRTVEALQATPEGRDCIVLPLYGELSPERQDAALQRYPQRKVVVATNVAETSLTIDGVTLVVDSGLAKVARYDPVRGINTLLIEPISRSSADQRAGRAGRTAPGHCVRLWGEKEHAYRAAFDTPELHRIDLSETVLSLLRSGVGVDDFPWFERPDPKAIERAQRLLHDLGATNGQGALTPLGRRMAAFPLHPRYARLLLAADELGCLREAALVAGLAQGRRVLLPVNDKRKESERENALGEACSDFIAECLAFQWAADQRFNPDACRTIGVHALAARLAAQAASQFLRLAEGQGLVPNETPADEAALRRCIFRAFSDHLALREDRGTLRCRMVHQRSGMLRRESLVRDATLLVAAELEETDVKGGVATLLGMNTAVEATWLEEDFPEDLNRERRVWLDPDQKRVVVREEERFRDLILQTRERGQPSEAEAATLLADEILAGRLNLKTWDAAVDQWIDRLNFAARHLPELGIAVLDDEGRRLLLENICLGAFSYREVRERPVWPTLRTWLSSEQAMAMDRLLPVEIKLPARNRTFRLRYEPEQVVLSAMIQDFYDADPARLRIADRIPITLEMLAPNRRPVQITSDLTAFWSGSYPAIRKELKGRYPKHDWR